MDKQILFDNIDRIHTTAMGVDRIKKNLSLNEVDVVEWCKSKIMSKKAEISKQEKKLVYLYRRMHYHCECQQLYNYYSP